jgi:hypothetical protein
MTKKGQHAPHLSNRPVRVVGYSTAKLYQDNLDYLDERNIPIAVALRSALADYVLDLKSKERGKPAWHTMTKTERDRQIMAAPDDYTRQEHIKPGVITQVIDRDDLGAGLHLGTAADIPFGMRTWTKKERVAWILNGVIPVRVMMDNRTATRS